MKRLAIVGATGVVGRCILKVLEEEKLKIDEYVLLASKRSKGTKLFFMNKEYQVEELTENSFDKKIDYAIFSAGAETAKKYAPIAIKNGTIVIDNSSAFRMEKNVPLIVPEVNKKCIDENHGIIANPNCSTIQAIVPLKVIDDLYKIKRIVYSTYQAVSGAGKNGIEDLKKGIEEYYIDNIKNNEIEKKNKQINKEYHLSKFKYPIFNNILPQIDVFTENGYTKEEMKIINETRKILNKPELRITATCARVPIFNSHAESINVELENDFNEQELIKALKQKEGIIVMDDFENDIYPLPTIATGNNEIFIGRIRRDNSVKYGLNLWIVADNIRKGAATNAVQIVKELINEKMEK